MHINLQFIFPLKKINTKAHFKWNVAPEFLICIGTQGQQILKRTNDIISLVNLYEHSTP